MRRALLLLTKAATSILLLYFSLRWVNVGALAERLSRFEWGWVTLAVLLLGAETVLLAARWREIATICHATLAFNSALQITFIATFFNQVLPSTIGGDGARIWLFARQGAGWAKATYSVLVDRIVGLVVLALVVIACLPYTFTLIDDSIARAVLLVIGFGTVAGAALVVLAGLQFRQFFNRWIVTRHLSSALYIVAAVFKSHRSATIVLACSVAIHLLTVAAAWCCVKAIAAPVSFAQVLFLFPPVILISSMPVSIAGWGVRESSTILAFAYAGLSQSDGLFVSILFGAASFLVGVVGGIIWIVSGLGFRIFNERCARPEPVPTTEIAPQKFQRNATLRSSR
jgi:glycosyltransferase 2 family protein